MSDGSGNLIARNAYSPSGQPDSWTVSRFGYTGQAAIPEAMLWHYKARAYAPRLGRFLQTDPIGTQGGINLYAYAAGDPINGTDPSGMVVEEIVVTAPVIKTITLAAAVKLTTAAAAVAKFGGSILKSIFGGGHSSPKPPQNATTNPSSTASGGEYNPTTDSVSEIAVQASSSSGSLAPRIASLANSVACSIPTFTAGFGADAYAGLGGSVSGGVDLDLINGRFGLSGSIAVGIGLGIDAGPSLGASSSGGGIFSGNVAVNSGGTIPVVPSVNVGASGTYNLIGSSPGFSSGSIGRAGTPVGYLNAGGNVGVSTPSFYKIKC